MAHRMLKPYSFLFYVLAFIFSFFVGIMVARVVGAGKGQMLAAGAIVLGYGVVGALLGLALALFITNKTDRKFVIAGNITLAILIALFWGYFYIKHQNKQKAKEQENIEQTKRPTAPTKDVLAMAELSF